MFALIFLFIILPAILVSTVIRLIVRPFRHAPRPWRGYSPYYGGCSRGYYGRPRFGLGSLLFFVALERLFDHRRF